MPLSRLTYTNQHDRGFGGGHKAGMRLRERGRRSVGEVRFGNDGQAAALVPAPAAAAPTPAAAPAARWEHMYTSSICRSCYRLKTKWYVIGCWGMSSFILTCQDQLV